MKNTKEILIVAGEDSGDTLGASIVTNFPDNKIHFFGCGGWKMAQQKVELLYTTEELSIVGFFEILANYRRLKKILKKIVSEATNRNIQTAVLIDYPGFNMRLAKQLKKHNIKSTLVVSPQIWAWHYSRIYKISELFSNVLCLYKFEVDIYKKEGKDVAFMGHPLVDNVKASLKEYREHGNPLTTSNKYKKIVSKATKFIALLPGSRASEALAHGQFMLDLAERYIDNKEVLFLMPIANDRVHEIMKSFDIPKNVLLLPNQIHSVLALSQSAVACSGTVTLECALFSLPFLLIYKVNKITYFIGKRIIKIPFLGIVNIIMKREITKEFLQKEMRLDSVKKELDKLNNDKSYRKTVIANLKQAAKEAGTGNSGKKAAQIIYSNLK